MGRSERLAFMDCLEEKMKGELEALKNLKEINETLVECTREKDALILRILRQSEEERQEKDEIQKELTRLSSDIGMIGKSITSGFEMHRRDLEQWSKRERDLETELSEYRKSKQKLEDENIALKDEKQILIEKNENLFCEQEALKQRNEELSDEIQALKKRTSEDMEETGLTKAYSLYKRYHERTSQGERPFIQMGNNICEFIGNCGKEKWLEYIYEELRESNILWDGTDTEGIELLNDIIDFCIEILNQNYGQDQLQRQDVNEEDHYSGNVHYKKNDDCNFGVVKQVLLQGVRDGSGAVFKGCKAFVEISM